MLLMNGHQVLQCTPSVPEVILFDEVPEIFDDLAWTAHQNFVLCGKNRFPAGLFIKALCGLWLGHRVSFQTSFRAA